MNCLYSSGGFTVFLRALCATVLVGTIAAVIIGVAAYRRINSLADIDSLSEIFPKSRERVRSKKP